MSAKQSRSGRFRWLPLVAIALLLLTALPWPSSSDQVRPQAEIRDEIENLKKRIDALKQELSEENHYNDPTTTTTDR